LFKKVTIGIETEKTEWCSSRNKKIETRFSCKKDQKLKKIKTHLLIQQTFRCVSLKNILSIRPYFSNHNGLKKVIFKFLSLQRQKTENEVTSVMYAYSAVRF